VSILLFVHLSTIEHVKLFLYNDVKKKRKDISNVIEFISWLQDKNVICHCCSVPQNVEMVWRLDEWRAPTVANYSVIPKRDRTPRRIASDERRAATEPSGSPVHGLPLVQARYRK